MDVYFIIKTMLDVVLILRMHSVSDDITDLRILVGHLPTIEGVGEGRSGRESASRLGFDVGHGVISNDWGSFNRAFQVHVADTLWFWWCRDAGFGVTSP